MKRSPYYSIIPLFTLLSICSATIINVPNDQPTIQAGIDAAVDGDTVLVYPGRYLENINYNGANIVLGSLFLITGDTTYISKTVINGGQKGSVVRFANQEDSNAVLSGFTITNGSAFGEYKYDRGGGIYCYSSSPNINHVYIIRNRAEVGGGGIFCERSNPNLKNILITQNSAAGVTSMGGGIFCYYSSPRMVNVTIQGNKSTGGGGGVHLWNYSSPVMVNVTIAYNTAEYGGGISCRNGSNPTLINTTLSRNKAKEGGGIFFSSNTPGMNSHPRLVNTIFWNDAPQELYFSDISQPGSITIAYSDIRGGEAGIITNGTGTVNWLEGNLDVDPLFSDSGRREYHLQDDSPCIDAGTPFYTIGEDTLIGPGSITYNGSAPDMGANEYEPFKFTVTDISQGHNSENTGPFLMLFRIKPIGWELGERPFYIHYGLGTVSDSMPLVIINYEGENTYAAWTREYYVSGTSQLHYYLSVYAYDNTRVLWPTGAPINLARMTFGPDTTAPVIMELNDLSDVHFQIPSTKSVYGTVHDRFGITPVLKWQVEDGIIHSESLVQDILWDTYNIPSPKTVWTGVIKSSIVELGDTIYYWIEAVDGSKNHNKGYSKKKWFIGREEMAIGPWDQYNRYWFDHPWDMQENELIITDPFDEWDNVLFLALRGADSIKVYPYQKTIDLRETEEAYLYARSRYNFFEGVTFGYVEVSKEGKHWDELERITGLGLFSELQVNLNNYLNEDSLRIRFRLERFSSRSGYWVIDDVYIHTDSSRLNVINPILTPNSYTLHQNHPNPFNPVTTIRYKLPKFSHVRLSIYDILGREIAQLINTDQSPGIKQVRWNASQVPSGIYFVQMTARDFRQVRKVMVLK